MSDSLFELKTPKETDAVIDIDQYKENRVSQPKGTKYQGRLNRTVLEESANTSETPTGSGGGGGMNDILRRIDNLEQGQKDLKDDLKDKVSKSDLDKSTLELKLYMRELFEKVPTEDRIKTIFSEQLKSHGVATETFVSNKVGEARLSTILWIIATTIAIAGLIFTIIRLYS
ncbi:hypothetical protein ACIFQM_00765 [Paenibacillus sp. NRS-1782]|uniref:hypothetical protein n=1 Tax=unclassified Paenibacillus TaxID=185978 RepID=UPI003D2C7C89